MSNNEKIKKKKEPAFRRSWCSCDYWYIFRKSEPESSWVLRAAAFILPFVTLPCVYIPPKCIHIQKHEFIMRTFRTFHLNIHIQIIRFRSWIISSLPACRSPRFSTFLFRSAISALRFESCPLSLGTPVFFHFDGKASGFFGFSIWQLLFTTVDVFDVFVGFLRCLERIAWCHKNVVTPNHSRSTSNGTYYMSH